TPSRPISHQPESSSVNTSGGPQQTSIFSSQSSSTFIIEHPSSHSSSHLPTSQPDERTNQQPAH
ncbi:MAG: hypothetical protein KC587_19265, partial [Nitrospira sp.]|nr:hypothetical protein [Nitrospira sp.]